MSTVESFTRLPIVYREGGKLCDGRCDQNTHTACKSYGPLTLSHFDEITTLFVTHRHKECIEGESVSLYGEHHEPPLTLDEELCDASSEDIMLYG